MSLVKWFDKKMSEFMENLGNRLKSARKKMSFTQEDAARVAGVSARAWQTWERGDNEPGISALEKFAKACDISLMELITGEMPSESVPVNIAGLPPLRAGQKIKLLLTIEIAEA